MVRKSITSLLPSLSQCPLRRERESECVHLLIAQAAILVPTPTSVVPRKTIFLFSLPCASSEVCCWKIHNNNIIGKDTNRSGKSNPETLTCSASHYAAPCGRVFPAVPRLGTAACFRPRYQKDERCLLARVPTLFLSICCGLFVVPQTAWLGSILPGRRTEWGQMMCSQFSANWEMIDDVRQRNTLG